MAYTTINKSSDFFNTITYSGNGSNPRTLTGVGFQPDWVWQKNRTDSNGHTLADAVRGANKTLSSDGNSAEVTDKDDGHLDAFTSDGFTVGAGSSSDARVNDGSHTYVAWNWKANGSSTTTNNDGATTSYISHNSTAQFSIIKYTGTGSNTNIGHGLNGTPDCFITKGYSGATDWHLWNNSFSANQRIKLNSTGGVSTNTSIFPTLPDATKIYLGSGGDVNQSGIYYICYAWKNVAGYSKFGSYVGNNNANGSFIYTGFKPSFVVIKKTNDANDWFIQDNKRLGYNPSNSYLEANTNLAEQTETDIDILSNGFKCRSTGGGHNNGNYIYMAFGQSIVGSNNIPATAR